MTPEGESGSTAAPVRRKVGEVRALPEYQLNPEARLISVKFSKKVRAADIEKYAALLRIDPLFGPDFSEIVDLTDVEELDLQPDEFIRLADEVDPFSLEARRAFIVSNEIQNHAARMHKILRTQRSFSIFRSVHAAERWIAGFRKMNRS